MGTTLAEWWCLWRHKKWVIIERVSWCTDHVKCVKCGREYGMNHDVRAILPWRLVRCLYERESESYTSQ